MRTEQDTMVPLAAHIALPKLGRASSLEISCTALHRADTGSVTVLCVAGSLDSVSSDHLMSKIDQLFDSDRLSRLIVDMQDVRRMDSSGVAILLTALREAGKQGVRFTLCNLPKPLHIMLERMKLASLFEIQPAL